MHDRCPNFTIPIAEEYDQRGSGKCSPREIRFQIGEKWVRPMLSVKVAAFGEPPTVTIRSHCFNYFFKIVSVERFDVSELKMRDDGVA